jgi:glycosyltransferase involved in cell wall biosynthesis
MTDKRHRLARLAVSPAPFTPECRRERIPVSVVVPTFNEATNLGTALETVKWADEVIVADRGSTDETRSIAEAAGARVLRVAASTIGAQRNAAIAVARNHWILALDADERVSPELRDAIAGLCRETNPRHVAYKVRSRNWHLGRELRHGPWGRDWKVRVFARDQRFSDARVHENLVSLHDVGVLEGSLLHHPYRDLSHQVLKVAIYAEWAAQDLRMCGRHASMVDMIVRPVWRFVRDYFLYSGWKDGWPGFIVSTVSAFSVFCKYASLRTMVDAPPRDHTGLAGGPLSTNDRATSAVLRR